MNLELVIATTNRGKAKEIERLLADLPVPVSCLSLAELQIEDHPEEWGQSFAENAMIKANHYSQKLPGRWVAAEDSGLQVDALDGEPGVHSARYAGEEANDASNIQKLLHKMKNQKLRKARFVTVVALAHDGKTVQTFYGAITGTIINKPKGTGGFGYDPVFLYPPWRKTFAQLTTEEKNQISHRYRAFQKVKAYLRDAVLTQHNPER
jgi:XTP/dITP diphosphohydrolase